MASRSKPMMQSILGAGVDIDSATDDDDFFRKLTDRKWSVVMFAPGACRYSAARQRIPGSKGETTSWGLEQYRDHVLRVQGPDTKIVETADEREIAPLLRAAFSPK
jgi:hypothetical protein